MMSLTGLSSNDEAHKSKKGFIMLMTLPLPVSPASVYCVLLLSPRAVWLLYIEG